MAHLLAPGGQRLQGSCKSDKVLGAGTSKALAAGHRSAARSAARQSTEGAIKCVEKQALTCSRGALLLAVAWCSRLGPGWLSASIACTACSGDLQDKTGRGGEQQLRHGLAPSPGSMRACQRQQQAPPLLSRPAIINGSKGPHHTHVASAATVGSRRAASAGQPRLQAAATPARAALPASAIRGVAGPGPFNACSCWWCRTKATLRRNASTSPKPAAAAVGPHSSRAEQTGEQSAAASGHVKQ
jgi:hypothetical protein